MGAYVLKSHLEDIDLNTSDRAYFIFALRDKLFPTTSSEQLTAPCCSMTIHFDRLQSLFRTPILTRRRISERECLRSEREPSDPRRGESGHAPLSGDFPLALHELHTLLLIDSMQIHNAPVIP